MDKFPDLRILLAHSGGTIPFLAGRLDSCVDHDPTVRERLKHPPSWYLKRLYYDGVGYHSPALRLAKDFVGADRIMFGYAPLLVELFLESRKVIVELIIRFFHR